MARGLESPPVASPIGMTGPLEVRGLDPQPPPRPEQGEAFPKEGQRIMEMLDDVSQGQLIVMFVR